MGCGACPSCGGGCGLGFKLSLLLSRAVLGVEDVLLDGGCGGPHGGVASVIAMSSGGF